MENEEKYSLKGKNIQGGVQAERIDKFTQNITVLSSQNNDKHSNIPSQTIHNREHKELPISAIKGLR